MRRTFNTDRNVNLVAFEEPLLCVFCLVFIIFISSTEGETRKKVLLDWTGMDGR